MAPVIHAMREDAAKFNTIICVTAQHRQMLDQVLELFDIVPDYDMDIMSDNQDLFDVTSRALTGLKSIIHKEQPDIVLVQGDTTTAFVASLAAFYLNIRIGHIEAGLRTYDKYHPFPEEKNRHMISVLADFHFAPTQWAKCNMLNEGIAAENIWVTGNTVIDALLMTLHQQSMADKGRSLEEYFKNEHKLDLFCNSKRIILVTGHRRENFGEGFRNICEALKEISQQREDILIVYPVHLNPNVQEPVKTILDGIANVCLIEPLQYEPFVFLMSRSCLILTDSGGVQEEAPSMGKPVLVMRNTTERPEGVEAGVVKLVGTHKGKIVNETLSLLNDKQIYDKMAKSANPYGDGNSSKRIVEILGQSL
jgi:UDP-N-acetylglucosamine 2-epimerase (non-hydrolysing)